MKKGTRDIPKNGTATHRVWEEVAAQGPLTARQVSERTGLRHKTVSSVAQNLAERGLLDRDEETEQLKLP